MKKKLLFSVIILFSGIMYGQTIEKSTLIGTHIMDVTLKPGVSMDQFTAFFITRFIPEVEKNLSGWHIYLLKGIRGENPNSLGILYVIDSEEERDKYYDADGYSEVGKKMNEKMKPVNSEMEKLGSFTTKYTDWIVQ